MQGDHDDLPLTEADRALLGYALKLSRQPEKMQSSDVEALRSAGFSDLEIHDAAQITALFNYFNRLANGLGIDDEPEWGER